MPAGLPSKFLYMKVGDHAHEEWQSILSRKLREIRDTGGCFWGYGGNTLHPFRVQQLAREAGLVSLWLLMQRVQSSPYQPKGMATHYSIDKRDWLAIPKGIVVTGSRYALVFDEIHPSQLEIPLDQCYVWGGPSGGRKADQYLRGHVDKGSFEYRADRPGATEPIGMVPVSYSARLSPPYSVFVR